jgi:hypothetical protein
VERPQAGEDWEFRIECERRVAGKMLCVRAARWRNKKCSAALGSGSWQRHYDFRSDACGAPIALIAWQRCILGMHRDVETSTRWGAALLRRAGPSIPRRGISGWIALQRDAQAAPLPWLSRGRGDVERARQASPGATVPSLRLLRKRRQAAALQNGLDQ